MEEKTHTMVKEFLAALGISAEDISMEKDELGGVFSIRTSDSRNLIGTRGETLLAMNYLAKKIAEKRGVSEPFSIDVNGYQKERINDLRAKAHLLAERAKAFQTDIEMDPMSSYERMVVHAALADTPDIKTESTGVGRERKVVIKYETKDV